MSQLLTPQLSAAQEKAEFSTLPKDIQSTALSYLNPIDIIKMKVISYVFLQQIDMLLASPNYIKLYSNFYYFGRDQALETPILIIKEVLVLVNNLDLSQSDFKKCLNDLLSRIQVHEPFHNQVEKFKFACITLLLVNKTEQDLSRNHGHPELRTSNELLVVNAARRFYYNAKNLESPLQVQFFRFMANRQQSAHFYLAFDLLQKNTNIVVSKLICDRHPLIDESTASKLKSIALIMLLMDPSNTITNTFNKILENLPEDEIHLFFSSIRTGSLRGLPPFTHFYKNFLNTILNTPIKIETLN